MSARNMPVATLVLLPGMALALRGVGSVDPERRSRGTAFAAVALALLGVMLAVSVLGGRNYNFRGYPVASIDWMESEGMLDADTRLVTRDYVGNYLEATHGTDIPVFIDDRYDMFPVEVAEDYFELLRWIGVGGHPRPVRHRGRLVAGRRAARSVPDGLRTLGSRAPRRRVVGCLSPPGKGRGIGLPERIGAADPLKKRSENAD